MKHLLATFFLATFCAATGYGQTVKALAYNTTNGQIVYSGTNALTFTNPISLLSTNPNTVSSLLLRDTDGIAFDGEGFATNFPAIYFADDGSSAAATRTNLGLGATWLTNTNADNFREAIAAAAATNFGGGVGPGAANRALTLIGDDGTEVLRYGELGSEGWLVTDPDTFRTALGLGLPALTETSNVRMMRALAGSTNTNQPFNGTITIRDFNDDAHDVTISNGIILNWQVP